MLNDEDTPLHTRHRNSHRQILLTSDSSSDGEGEGEGEGEGRLLNAQSNTQHAVSDELSGTKLFPMASRSKLLSFAYRKSQLSANSVEERMTELVEEGETKLVEGGGETGGGCEEERRGGLGEEGRELVDGEEEIGGGCEEVRRGGLGEEGREPVDGEEEIGGGCEEGREGGYRKEKEALVNTVCSATEVTDSTQPIGVSCDMERGKHELITTTVWYMYIHVYYIVWTYVHVSQYAMEQKQPHSRSHIQPGVFIPDSRISLYMYTYMEMYTA